jgi:hypothetical protein
MGRGPVCGIMIRLAGGPGTAGALEATAGSALGVASVAVAESAAIGCSAVATDAGMDSAVTVGICGTRDGTAAPADAAGTAGLVSCGAFFAGTATTVDAPVNPDAGGFTITGPDGAREAIAGVGVGVVETIGGACRGNGTIRLGAGSDPATPVAPALAGAALVEALAEVGLLTARPAAEALAVGAETVGLAGPAAAAVTVGRGAAVAPRCRPCDSRCSFCC